VKWPGEISAKNRSGVSMPNRRPGRGVELAVEHLGNEVVRNIAQIAVITLTIAALLLRSWIGGLLVVLPLALTVAVNFGVMGLLGIPLDAVLKGIGSSSDGRSSAIYAPRAGGQKLALERAYADAGAAPQTVGLLEAHGTGTRVGDATELAALIDAELQRLTSGGPTDAEMERAEAQAEAAFMYRLQTVGGFGGKSDQLNAYNTFLGRPDYFAEDLARYEGVTKLSLQQTAARYLHDGRRVMMSIVPRGRLDLAIADSSAVAVS